MRPTVFGLWRDGTQMKVFLLSPVGNVEVANVGDRVFAAYRVEQVASAHVTLIDEQTQERVVLSAPAIPSSEAGLQHHSPASR